MDADEPGPEPQPLAPARFGWADLAGSLIGAAALASAGLAAFLLTLAFGA